MAKNHLRSLGKNLLCLREDEILTGRTIVERTKCFSWERVYGAPMHAHYHTCTPMPTPIPTYTLVDVCFITRDGQRFCAHKVVCCAGRFAFCVNVLSAAAETQTLWNWNSDYFRNLFSFVCSLGTSQLAEPQPVDIAIDIPGTVFSVVRMLC